MIGNFIADEVKGKKHGEFPFEIAQGILMHRFIDSYTDTHPNVLKCTKILRPHISKFSPVALDVFFDYFLAKDWHKHHPDSLSNFTQSTYQLLLQNTAFLPERSKYILKYMSTQDWLLHYAKIEGIKKALSGMASRSKYGSILDGSEKYLLQYEHELQLHFDIFFDTIKSEIKLSNWAI
jgi:acyl carrier protein phosphodiesterase